MPGLDTVRWFSVILVVLHKSLGQDVRDGLIPRNVTEAVKVPQVRHKGIEPL